jgi:hypothetical protein
LIVVVRGVEPERCEPPSMVLMLLANEKTVSVVTAFLERDLDQALLVVRLEVDDGRWIGSFSALTCARSPGSRPREELLRPLAAAVVGEADPEAAREERGLAESLAQRLAREVEFLEDLGVGEERDRRPRVVRVGRPDLLEVGHRNAARELLSPDLPVAPNLATSHSDRALTTETPDAVEAARHLVAVAAELAARVELREDDRQRREVDPRSCRSMPRPWSTTVTE